MWKSWADIHSLYRIGAIISKECPTETIDGMASYEFVELLIVGKTDPNKINENLKRFGFYLRKIVSGAINSAFF
jgi:hypothetical protein